MRRTLFALVSLLLATAAMAEERQFADVIYRAPSGWEPGREVDGSKIFLSELPGKRCNLCRFYLSASQPFDGSLDSYIDENLTRFEDQEKRAEFELIGEPKTLNIAGYSARLHGYKMGRKTLYFFAALDLNDRKNLLTFRANYYDPEELSEVVGVFSDQIAPFFNSIRFSSSGLDGLLPAAEPGKMTGILWGWRQSVSPGLDGTIKTEIKHEALIFFPDGHVYRGSPAFGIHSVPREDLIGAFDKNLGVYNQRGRNQVDITFLDGQKHSMKWNRSERAWDFGKFQLIPVTPLSDDTPVEGIISDFSYHGLAPSSVFEGGATGETETRFFADGTFVGESFGSVSGSFGGGAITSARTQLTNGSYIVKDGLLTMRDRSGAVSSELIFKTEHGILVGDLFLKSD